MARILVIHWNPLEAAEGAARARRAGFEAEAYPHRGSAGLRAIRATPPDAIVVDLTSMPSYGRAMGALLREQKGTRMIPLVFIEGDPEKSARVRELLPDAVFTSWLGIAGAVRRAIRDAPREPVLPDPSRIPLAKKLRIREGSSVALLRAPEGFQAKLAPLPEGVRLQTKIDDADVVLTFVKSAAAIGRELASLARDMRKGRTLWLMWPKKSSGRSGDLSMPRIREMAQAVGLVDYKVCAVDETWSGMALGIRRGRGAGVE